MKTINTNNEETTAAMLPTNTPVQDVAFMMTILEEFSGGKPTFGYNEDYGWVAVPTCTCEECQGFAKYYKPEPKPTLAGAARAYAVGMTNYLRLQEPSEPNTKH